MMNNIIPYLAIFIIFILRLISKVSINPSLREKFTFIVLFGFLLTGAYLFYFQIENIPYMSGAHMFVYTMALPEIIARIVNARRIKSKSIQISTNISNITFGFLGVIIFAILTVIVLYFLVKEIISPENGTIFDLKYFLTRFNFLLVLILGIIWMYLFATQKIIFYSEGLFINGEIWKWSDFDFYSWSKRAFENDAKELALATAKNIWFPAQIKINVPPESKKRVDVLLEKKLESL